jgi:hypothetical protein
MPVEAKLDAFARRRSRHTLCAFCGQQRQAVDRLKHVAGTDPGVLCRCARRNGHHLRVFQISRTACGSGVRRPANATAHARLTNGIRACERKPE